MRGFKKQILIIFLITMLPLFAWEKFYGTNGDDFGSSVQQTEEDYYILGGTTIYTDDDINAYLTEIDNNGNIIWNYNYGCPESLEILYSVQQTPDWGFIGIGEVWHFNPANEQHSCGLIIKTDYDGNKEWIFHRLEGWRTFTSFVYLPNEDSVAVTGWQNREGLGTWVWWGKIGPIGGKGSGPGSGGTERIYLPPGAVVGEGHSIKKIDTPWSGYIIVGGAWYQDIGSTHCQDGNVYLIGINDKGDKLYEQTFGGPDEDIGYCGQQTSSDGGFIIVGGTRSYGSGGWDVYLIKVKRDQWGNFIKEWEKTYGGAKDDIGYSVEQTPDSGYIICGATQSFNADGRDEIYFIRVDKYGNKLFEKTFGKPQFYCYGSSIKLTSNGGYIIVGTERYAGNVPINKGDEIYCIYADPVNSPTLWCFNPVVFGGLLIHWADNSTNEVRFEIDRKIGEAGVYVKIGTTNANITSYYDTDFGSYYGQDVYYRVRAVSEYNSSAPSNELKVKIPGPGIFSDTVRAIDYDHSSRNLYRDNNSNYHLILKHHNRLWYTKSTDNGATWSLGRNLAWVGPEIPSVVATSTGLPCFVWEEKSGTAPNFIYDLVYGYIDAQGDIHKTTLVDNADHDLSPAIAITSDDQIYVTFVQTYSDNGIITCLKFNYNNPQYNVYLSFTNCYFPARIRMVVDYGNFPCLVWDEYWFKSYQNINREVRRIYHGWINQNNNPVKEFVAEGWLSGYYRRIVSSPDIRYTDNSIQVCWQVNIEQPAPGGWNRDIYYRAKTGNQWGNTINITQDPDIGDSPVLGRIIGGKVFCLGNTRIFVVYPGNPTKSAALVDQANNYDAVPAPSGTIGGAAGIVYARNTNQPDLFKVCFTIKTIPYIPPYNPVVYSAPIEPPPEFTAYNNSHRLLRDAKGVLHLAFTSGDNVYHTFLQDTAWSEPELVGEGKYPTLAMGPDDKIYCVWCYNEGLPNLLEELRMSRWNGNHWSAPIPLMHTYNSFLWGVGAPSLAIKDSIAYITFKSYFGPTYHPEPGAPAPQVIVLESRHLIYGKFPLNNPGLFSFSTVDAIGIPPTPVAPLVYQDSLVPLLISPSIAVDLAGVPHILWEGDSTCMRYYTIIDTVITTQLFDEGVDFPFLTMNRDQVQLFWTARDSVRYRYGWTGTANLSETQTIATCESPISSGQYLTWTKRENGISHLYYGAIPASGAINPVEINYSTDLISYPQILFNPKPPSIDLVWTEYSEIDSLGYIYYLNLPLTEVAPKYAFDMGQETPVPICVHRDGYITLGPEDYQTFDYDSTELIYHLTLHDFYETKVPTPPGKNHTKYKICWTYYHQEPEKLKLGLDVDDILHHNRWVEPGEIVTEEAYLPDATVQDNVITIRIEVLNGTIAVLSGLEIYAEIVGEGGGPQGSETQIARRFYFERLYPNPAKGLLRIRFNSPDERKATIKLYDVTGRLVQKECVLKSKIGMNEVLIKPEGLSAGVYFVRLETEGYNKIEKAVLIK